MRARICSALSCDMFARVVWLRLRRARDSRLSLCHLPHALATHYFLRLTRARGVSSQREGNALFADFWYFWSRKSTIKEKWLYLKKTPHPSAYGCHLLPQSRRRRPRLLRKSVNSPLEKAYKTHQPNFTHIFVIQHSVKVVKGRNAQFCFKRNKASCQPSPVGEGEPR